MDPSRAEPNVITNFKGLVAMGYSSGPATDGTGNHYVVITDIRVYKGAYRGVKAADPVNTAGATTSALSGNPDEMFLFLMNLVLLAPYWVPAWDRIIGTGSREHPAVSWIQAGLWANIGLISTLATCEFIWVSMALLDPLAGLYAGPLSTLLAPFPLLLFWECSVSRHRWWSRVLFFLAGGFAGMVYKGLYEAEVSAEQEARNRRAKRLLSTIDQQRQSSRVHPFCLYFRSFQTTGHLDAQQRGSVEALDLETVLERSLESRLPLPALGRNSENAVLGSSRVYVPDEVWWTYFTRLANLAAWIFVLPSDQGSTPDEISWLLSNGHLGKCIFIMPETNTGEGWHVEVYTPSTVHVSEGESIDYRPYWESVRVGLSQKLGFDLPP